MHPGRPAIDSTALFERTQPSNLRHFSNAWNSSLKWSSNIGQVGEAGNEADVHGWLARMNTCLEGTHPCRRHGTRPAMRGLDADLLSWVGE